MENKDEIYIIKSVNFTQRFLNFFGFKQIYILFSDEGVFLKSKLVGEERVFA